MEVTRTFDIIDQLLEKYPREDALAVKRNGRWEKFSTQEYKNNVDYFSLGLLSMGFKPGDKIVTMSNNRPEWNFMDMGMAQVGVIHVPIYANNSERELKHIFAHSEARMLIVSSKELYDRVIKIANNTENIEKVWSIDPVEGVSNFDEIIELGKKNKDVYYNDFTSIRDKINPDDLLSIIYTSGTTGLSKGVMLTHTNFLSNVKATKDILPIGEGHRSLSFLPLCHVLEREVNYLHQFKGIGVYYAENIDSIGENLREIKPHGFTTVPRVIEKLYDKIMLLGKELTGVKRKLFFWAVNLGLRYELNGANGWWYEQQLKLANKLIFVKWREALGGNIKVIVSGGAALQPRLARIFYAAGIPINEGYGLTETSPVISVNHPKYPYIKFGTVGPVIDNVEVKIAEDGEILMKGPNLMKGYYKDPEKTKEVIDKDGWFHTGDIGELGEYNILKITDRKKEIFKLTTGKYVAPQLVENKFKESPFIDQLMVVGEGEKFAAAIISPDFEVLHKWATNNNVTYRDNVDLIDHPKVIARIQKEVDRINATLSRHRQIKKFALTCRPWTPDTGELSPTLKLKRKQLKKTYKKKLDYLYGYSDDPGHLVVKSKE
jgi:long-chain acyl-CoA synthetase